MFARETARMGKSIHEINATQESFDFFSLKMLKLFGSSRALSMYCYIIPFFLRLTQPSNGLY